MIKPPMLLIDADIVAYQVAARNQQKFNWGDTGQSEVVDKDAARKDIDEVLAGFCETLKSDKVCICLSDDEVNFRKQLEPTYKGNRKEQEKPALLAWAKEYLYEGYASIRIPRLEADDVMGMMATSPNAAQSHIIVSEDKDMKTLPNVWWYNPRHHQKSGPQFIDELDAKRFHMEQTLTGDPTDGYPGCPGIGPKSKFVKELWGAPAEDLWEIVMAGYESKGKTEQEAILQARLAHILWHSSYNLKTEKIRLWRPEWLTDPSRI